MGTGGSRYHATDGAAYELFLGRWTRALSEVVLDFAQFAGDAPLLDAGCGTGSLARAMARRWPARKVIGVDVAPAYVSFARGLPATGLPSYDVADIASLPFADGEFGGAAAQLVLNFVPDPVRAVRELTRVVMPGEPVVAAVWDFRGGLVYQRMVWDTVAEIEDGAAAVRNRLFSDPLALPDGLVHLFHQAGGLDRIEQASLTIRMNYSDFDDYWRPMCGGQGPVGAYLAGLSPERRERIEQAVRRSFLSGAPDGPRSMTATAWAVRALVGSPQVP